MAIRGFVAHSTNAIRSRLAFAKASSAQYPLTLARRFNAISSSPPSTTRVGLAEADKETSLAWIQLHEQSPASYGIWTASGYEEVIPRGAPLPCNQTEKFETADDYFRNGAFPIFYRQSIMDVPRKIQTLDLMGIRYGKKGVAKIKATMTLAKDLTGSLTVKDTYTRNSASAVFDGGVAYRAHLDCKAVASTNSGISV